MISKELENGQTIREEVQRDPEGKTVTNAHENTELWRSRQIQISDLIKSWFDVCRASKDNSLPAESYPDGSLLDDSSWFLLPPKLVEWLQSQDGLKIKGKEIESREDLERAFGLLRCDPKKLQNGCVDTSPIKEIAIEVGYKYTEYARLSRRKPIILEWTIPLPKVISRACASCKRPVLDDAFPYFAKNDQSFYILRTLQFTGCGLPGCEGSVVLVPWDKWQNSMKPNKPDLEKPLEQPNGRADWSSFFCRSRNELGKLPETVQIRCSKCGAPRLESRARWTIERSPRFVIPILKCNEPPCNGRDRSFKPIHNFRSIHGSALSKYWKESITAGFNPANASSLRSKFLERLGLSNLREAMKAGQHKPTDVPPSSLKRKL